MQIKTFCAIKVHKMDLVPEESREEVFAKQVATVKDIAGAYRNPTPEALSKPILL